MTSMPKRSFQNIRFSASNIGDRMNHLERKMMDSDYSICSDTFDAIQGTGDLLVGIYYAMTIIAETAGADINQEALDAFARELETAERVLAEDWTKELMADFRGY